MGILDDAIREHLELKRAHGASEEEVRTKEAEAFGAQHGAAAEAIEPAQPASDDPYAVHPGDHGLADSHDHAIPDPHDHEHPVAADPAWAEDAELFAEPAPPPQPAPPQHHPEDERHPALHDTDEHFHGASDAPEPVFHNRAEAPPAGAPEAPVSPQAPVEEPDPDAEPDSGETEDVLEETPEFLQDAPEHDRLWFEQKPPRDFDFGE